MPQVVLDSSAILASLWSEQGAHAVDQHAGNSIVSSVNMTEVYTKMIDRGPSPQVEAQVDLLHLASPYEIIPFDAAQARICSLLRTASRSIGLSLGDRACLALAIQKNAVVLTADRAWINLDIGVKIELIR
jgi:ribonuclease VapC